MRTWWRNGTCCSIPSLTLRDWFDALPLSLQGLLTHICFDTKESWRTSTLPTRPIDALQLSLHGPLTHMQMKLGPIKRAFRYYKFTRSQEQPEAQQEEVGQAEAIFREKNWKQVLEFKPKVRFLGNYCFWIQLTSRKPLSFVDFEPCLCLIEWWIDSEIGLSQLEFGLSVGVWSLKFYFLTIHTVWLR